LHQAPDSATTFLFPCTGISKPDLKSPPPYPAPLSVLAAAMHKNRLVRLGRRTFLRPRLA
jgi:hypothetical protein